VKIYLKERMKIMFSETLKNIMEEKGIRQIDLVKMTGIGKPSISQYLAGKNTPSPKNIKIIADALECSIEVLTVVTEKETPPQPKDEIKLTIAEAAARCGKSKEFIAGWLQDGNCPFGYARMGKGEKWDYIIPVFRLENYLLGVGM
jgi:transcriptional regulator with XRE-family HTH domain